MQIAEFEWLKKNKDKLSPEDKKELKDLGIFAMLDKGEVSMPAVDFLSIVNSATAIVEKYTEGEEL